MAELNFQTMTQAQAEEWVIRFAAAGNSVFLGHDGRVLQSGWLDAQPPAKAAHRAIQAGRLKHAFSTPAGWSTGPGDYFSYFA